MQYTSVMQIYDLLLEHYGEQHWWPADSAFEMMVGAILTQNTNWNNVEKALHQLRQADVLQAQALATCKPTTLQNWIRSAGFFRQKSERLQYLSHFYLQYGEVAGMQNARLEDLRSDLLQLNGIGPETADSILLYAADKAIFVVDNYTKRIFHRLGILPKQITKYDDVQNFFHQDLGQVGLSIHQELHALIVAHAKQYCRKQAHCEHCPLQHGCQHYQT